MEEILGIKKEDMLNKYIFDVHKDLEGSSSTLLNCLRTGKPINNKVKMQLNNKGVAAYNIVTNIPIIKDDEIIGAIEYIKTEDSYAELLKYIENDKKEEGLNRPKLNNSTQYSFDDFLTIEKNMLTLIENLKNMSLFDYNVLIYGETGTGKEIIAQSIHNSSRRKDKKFVAQNCAAIPENLLESIFFGTSAGSFTGATNRPGLFEQAEGGTLLLDELNSLPIFMQAKLLRALQEGYVRRVGGKEDIPVDVRIIATTNEKPDILIKEKRLREDLYYRLGPIYVDIPPLRQRKADIDYLTRIFIKRESKLIKVREPKLSNEVKRFFRDYPWQGNVRELKNVVSYVLLNTLCVDTVELEHLPPYMHEKMLEAKNSNIELDNLSYNEKVSEFERNLIKTALDVAKGNVSEASRLLGIKRQTLQYKIKILNIK